MQQGRLNLKITTDYAGLVFNPLEPRPSVSGRILAPTTATKRLNHKRRAARSSQPLRSYEDLPLRRTRPIAPPLELLLRAGGARKPA